MESTVEILEEYDISMVIDVRTVPYSRHNPQFNKEAFTKSLESKGIAYLHMKELGGFRHPQEDSINLGWNNVSFRGFADYMQTNDFVRGVRKLIEISEGKNIAIMCSEAVPWKCHRSLIADALTIRNINVTHILSKTISRRHELTSFAMVENDTITYPKK